MFAASPRRRRRRSLCGGVSCAHQTRLDDELWTDFCQVSVVMQEVFQALTGLRNNIDAPSAVVGQTRSILTAVFITMIVWCNIVYYPTVVTSLNKSIKNTRSLLLLLPEDVVHGVRALRETMTELSKRLLV